MGLPDGEDDALVERILAGDQAALRALIEREHATLLRFARAVTRESDLAEEAVQDSWVRIYRGLARFERRSSLRTSQLRTTTEVLRGLPPEAPKATEVDAILKLLASPPDERD